MHGDRWPIYHAMSYHSNSTYTRHTVLLHIIVSYIDSQALIDCTLPHVCLCVYFSHSHTFLRVLQASRWLSVSGLTFTFFLLCTLKCNPVLFWFFHWNNVQPVAQLVSFPFRGSPLSSKPCCELSLNNYQSHLRTWLSSPQQHSKHLLISTYWNGTVWNHGSLCSYSLRTGQSYCELMFPALLWGGQS